MSKQLDSKFLPIIAFWTVGIVWGMTYIFMKYATDLITPDQVAFSRVFFGFIPVFIAALIQRAMSFSHIKHIHHFFVASLLAATVYYFGFANAAALLPSGINGALGGSIPLFAFICAVLFLRDEKINLKKIVGVLVGFVGVVLIARPTGQDVNAINPMGVFYILLASLSCGASFVYVRKYISPLKIQPIALVTYQLGLATITYLVITDFTGFNNIWTSPRAYLGLIIGLGLLGTGFAYMIYYYIVDKLGAITASASTYIPPVVALLIGSLFTSESISLIDYIATAIIFLGVLLLRDGKPSKAGKEIEKQQKIESEKTVVHADSM
ncbi:putative inner membrane transporter YedA [Poriferisphaera corsica]|uniref:Putative inner membrane transporter YedA n=1 Tax=Poriferisphaera corsica TaxID=2528020 RepID=A0A517YSZ4_9BACT|nr:DMT family transporter [Poriferisphaera corsica]QDU33346.1 putative inner membrane transporter YedA [Poriferisphaera corsica]